MQDSLDQRPFEQGRVDYMLCLLYKIRHKLVTKEEEKYVPHTETRALIPSAQSRLRHIYPVFSLSPNFQWNQFTSQAFSSKALETFRTQISMIERSRLNTFTKNISSFYLSLTFLPSVFPLSFWYSSSFTFVFLVFTFSHSNGENPKNWGHTSIPPKADGWKANIIMMLKAREGPLYEMRTTQALISLRRCAGWSGPSLSAYRINGYCTICRQTDRRSDQSSSDSMRSDQSSSDSTNAHAHLHIRCSHVA